MPGSTLICPRFIRRSTVLYSTLKIEATSSTVYTFINSPQFPAPYPCGHDAAQPLFVNAVSSMKLIYGSAKPSHSIMTGLERRPFLGVKFWERVKLFDCAGHSSLCAILFRRASLAHPRAFSNRLNAAFRWQWALLFVMLF